MENLAVSFQKIQIFLIDIRKLCTVFDNQTGINIGIYEGESEKYKENHKLGNFIEGIAYII